MIYVLGFGDVASGRAMAEDSDDFFGNLDAKLNSQKAAKQATAERQDQLRRFVGEVVERLTPVAQDYADKLRLKGITATVQTYPTGITFKLRFRDGGHYDLSFGLGRHVGGLEFEGDYTNDDGRSFRSLDAASYKPDTWRDELFVGKLQQHIADYVFYSDRHQGVA